MIHIKSNVKGFVDVELEVPYALLMGRNGSGKSAIVHSAELACFGALYDAAGRDVKSKALVQHIAAPKEMLFSQVDFLDGSSRLWPNNFTDMRNPLHEAMEAMAGSTHKLMEYILRHADEDIEVELSFPYWASAVRSHGGYRQALLAMYTDCSASLRKHQATAREVKIAQKYVQTPELDDKAQQAEEAIAQNKKLLAEIKERMVEMVQGLIPTIENRMLRYTPEEMPSAQFTWIGKELRLGFGNRPVPSGAETVALGMALAAAVDHEHAHHVWILPDRAYDAKTLGNIMRVLRNIPARMVLVQSTVLPDGYDHNAMGWETVEV